MGEESVLRAWLRSRPHEAEEREQGWAQGRNGRYSRAGECARRAHGLECAVDEGPRGLWRKGMGRGAEGGVWRLGFGGGEA